MRASIVKAWRFLLQRPEWFAAGLTLLSGIFLIAATPPLQGGDEPAHIFRVYQLASGQLLGERLGDSFGGEVPRGWVETFTFISGDLPFHPGAKADPGALEERLWQKSVDMSPQFLAFQSAAYVPTTYLPYIPTMWLGLQLHAPPLVLVYALRFFGLLCGTATVFFALRLLPRFRQFFILLLLTPMYVFQLATVNGDMVTNSCTVLLVALVLRLAQDRRRASGRVLAVLAALSLTVGLSKTAYIPLLAVLLLLPTDVFGSMWRRATWLISIIVLAIGLSAAWIAASSAVYAPLRADVQIDPLQQLEFVLANPLHFIGVVTTDFISKFFNFYWDGFIGRLGWGDVALPLVAVMGYGLLLWFALLWSDGEQTAQAVYPRAVAALAIVTSALVIFLLVYLVFSPVGAGHIEGVQGRYFLPLAMLLPFALCASNLLRRFLLRSGLLAAVESTFPTIIFLATIAMQIVAGYAVFVRYFV